MFDFFASKNKKMVNRWHKDHEDIVDLAHKVMAEYAKNNQDAAKSYLKQLDNVAVEHFMSEDIELFKLVHNSENLDDETERLVKEFVESFRRTKLSLMEFFAHYSKPEVPLDDDFLRQFNEIVEAVAKRIEFEEKEVYSKLKEK